MTEQKPEPLCCETCRFSVTTDCVDPVTLEALKGFPGISDRMIRSKLTRCHLQGAPQKVHPTKDWCYQWEAK